MLIPTPLALKNDPLQLPKMLVIFDVSWFCRIIATDPTEENDEEGICEPIATPNDEKPTIDPLKKHLLTAIQLLLLKSAGCNVSMARASGNIAKDALKLDEEVVEPGTPLNFWNSSSQLIKRSVHGDCKFVFTSHISSVLRSFKLVCTGHLIFQGETRVSPRRCHSCCVDNKRTNHLIQAGCFGNNRFTSKAVYRSADSSHVPHSEFGRPNR